MPARRTAANKRSNINTPRNGSNSQVKAGKTSLIPAAGRQTRSNLRILHESIDFEDRLGVFQSMFGQFGIKALIGAEVGNAGGCNRRIHVYKSVFIFLTRRNACATHHNDVLGLSTLDSIGDSFERKRRQDIRAFFCTGSHS